MGPKILRDPMMAIRLGSCLSMTLFHFGLDTMELIRGPRLNASRGAEIQWSVSIIGVAPGPLMWSATRSKVAIISGSIWTSMEPISIGSSGMSWLLTTRQV